MRVNSLSNFFLHAIVFHDVLNDNPDGVTILLMNEIEEGETEGNVMMYRRKFDADKEKRIY